MRQTCTPTCSRHPGWSSRPASSPITRCACCGSRCCAQSTVYTLIASFTRFVFCHVVSFVGIIHDLRLSKQCLMNNDELNDTVSDLKHTLKCVLLQDLKPQNFMKVKGKLKLIDFGISQMIHDEVTSMIIQQPEGTPNYIAPEVCTFNYNYIAPEVCTFNYNYIAPEVCTFNYTANLNIHRLDHLGLIVACEDFAIIISIIDSSYRQFIESLHLI